MKNTQIYLHTHTRTLKNNNKLCNLYATMETFDWNDEVECVNNFFVALSSRSIAMNWDCDGMWPDVREQCSMFNAHELNIHRTKSHVNDINTFDVIEN